MDALFVILGVIIGLALVAGIVVFAYNAVPIP